MKRAYPFRGRVCHGKALWRRSNAEASILQRHQKLDSQSACRTASEWLGSGLDNHRFQPAALAGLTAGDVPKLKLAWAFGVPGTLRMYGQPTVAGGRVFIGTGTRKDSRWMRPPVA